MFHVTNIELPFNFLLLNMVFLDEKVWFPQVELANSQDILAIGGDLSVERLTLAYRSGIFPWFNEGEPIVWYAPKDRMVLFLEELKISKSMRQILKKNLFKVTFNKCFERVIYHCKTVERNDQFGTWITNDMERAYIALHKQGKAKSVEVWQYDVTKQCDQLVGGLYGVDLGYVFCGESMFSLVSNASKVGFIKLVEHLKDQHYQLLDCQVYNEHLASLGAREITRKQFMQILTK
jgi:leucyl/phenylalanyl-tRNA--protein transferase